MGIFLKDKEKDELALVFDIGSSSIGGALFWMQKTRVPKIFFSIREPIMLEEAFDIDRFLSLTAKALDIVANRIYQAKIGAPSKIFCVLSSPWHVSQTRVISLEKNAPFTFTPKLADDLIKKEINLFEEEHLKEYMHTGSPVRSIELKNIKTMLNGYETSNPLDQKAKELKMTIFVSMSPEQVLRKIEETIKRHFNFENIKFSSFALSSFAVVRDMYVSQEDFLLIDIGGEVTDIAMAKKNMLRESISFPLGLNFIIRGAASALRASLHEAKSSISLFKDGHATEPAAQKIKPVLEKLQTAWREKFQEALANISSDISIPATIYMAVDKDLADFFRRTIETEQFNQYTLTDSKFKVIFLGADAFHGLAVFDGEVMRDSSLIIESIYINRFLR